MGTTAWIVTGALVVMAGIVAVSVAVGGHRRRQVKDLFGPDDDRPGADVDLPEGLEHDLLPEDRLPLETEVAERYRLDWDRIQTGFVDRPALALHEADALVTGAMSELGYAVDRVERLGESDDAGPEPVQRYRTIQRVNLRADASETTTDELRRAFVQYRDLLDDLLHSTPPPASDQPARTGRRIRT
jgi:hypothetical protein